MQISDENKNKNQKATEQSHCLPWRRNKIFQSLVLVAEWLVDCWPNRHVELAHVHLCWSAKKEPIEIHTIRIFIIYMVDE